MATLKWEIETDADWEENFYHEIVKVSKGVAETDNPLTILGLLSRGFILVEE